MRHYFSEENRKTPSINSFCIDCETIRTLEKLSDTKNIRRDISSHSTLADTGTSVMISRAIYVLPPTPIYSVTNKGSPFNLNETELLN